MAGREDAPPALHGRDFSIKTEDNAVVIQANGDVDEIWLRDSDGNTLIQPQTRSRSLNVRQLRSATSTRRMRRTWR